MELEEQYKRNMAELREYDFQLSRAKGALDALAPTRQVDEKDQAIVTRSIQDDQIIQEDVALGRTWKKYVNFLGTYKRNSELERYKSERQP